LAEEKFAGYLAEPAVLAGAANPVFGLTSFPNSTFSNGTLLAFSDKWRPLEKRG
jgi:hypothetical protein